MIPIFQDYLEIPLIDYFPFQMTRKIEFKTRISKSSILFWEKYKKKGVETLAKDQSSKFKISRYSEVIFVLYFDF